MHFYPILGDQRKEITMRHCQFPVLHPEDVAALPVCWHQVIAMEQKEEELKGRRRSPRPKKPVIKSSEEHEEEASGDEEEVSDEENLALNDGDTPSKHGHNLRAKRTKISEKYKDFEVSGIKVSAAAQEQSEEGEAKDALPATKGTPPKRNKVKKVEDEREEVEKEESPKVKSKNKVKEVKKNVSGSPDKNKKNATPSKTKRSVSNSNKKNLQSSEMTPNKKNQNQSSISPASKKSSESNADSSPTNKKCLESKADSTLANKKSSDSKANSKPVNKKSSDSKAESTSANKKSSDSKADSKPVNKKSSDSKADTKPANKKSSDSKADPTPASKKSSDSKADSKPANKKSSDSTPSNKKSSDSTTTNKKSSDSKTDSTPANIKSSDSKADSTPANKKSSDSKADPLSVEKESEQKQDSMTAKNDNVKGEGDGSNPMKLPEDSEGALSEKTMEANPNHAALPTNEISEKSEAVKALYPITAEESDKTGREVKVVGEEKSIHACSVCKKEYTSYSGLSLHKKIHEEKKFKCDLCSYCSHYKANIDKHKEAVHFPEDGSTDLVPCLECGKQFKTIEAKNKHVRIMHVESELKPTHVCPDCGLGFSVQRKLKAHMKVHSNVMDHACEHCEMRFKRSKALNDHIKNIHLKQKEVCIETCHCGWHLSGPWQQSFGHPKTLNLITLQDIKYFGLNFENYKKNNLFQLFG